MTATTDAVTALREHWATRFTDAVAVTRMSGRGTFNETTLGYDAPAAAAIYTGGALIRPGQDVDRTQYGEQFVTGKAMLVYVTHDAAVFHVEDVVAVTSCVYNPALEGETLTVVAYDYDSYQTRIALVCRYDEGAGYVG
jgi:hypothetical protein